MKDFKMKDLIKYGDEVKKARDILLKLETEAGNYFKEEEKENLYKAYKYFEEFRNTADDLEGELLDRSKDNVLPQRYDVNCIFYGDLSRLSKNN